MNPTNKVMWNEKVGAGRMRAREKHIGNEISYMTNRGKSIAK